MIWKEIDIKLEVGAVMRLGFQIRKKVTLRVSAYITDGIHRESYRRVNITNEALDVEHGFIMCCTELFAGRFLYDIDKSKPQELPAFDEVKQYRVNVNQAVRHGIETYFNHLVENQIKPK